MFVLIDEDIREVRRGFKHRMQAAHEKLAKLLETAGTWQARENLKEKRHILISEIEYAKRLIDRAH